MNGRRVVEAIAIIGALGAAGCAKSIQVSRLAASGTGVKHDEAVCVAVPEDGSFRSKTYSGTGQAVAAILTEALLNGGADAVPARAPAPTEEALAWAAAEKCSYLVVPTILHWEDRATAWSGVADRATVRTDVLDVATGRTLESQLIQGKSENLVFRANSPAELVDAQLRDFVASLLGTVDEVSDARDTVPPTPVPTTAAAPPAADSTVRSAGTCFAVSPDGLVLTALHVVRDATSIQVFFPEMEPQLATIQQADPSNDLALLATTGPTRQFLPLAPPRSAQLGARVFTIGYPAITVLGVEAKYTEGTISALSGVAGDASLLQISVPIQPGNSGGPLVDEKGRVLGVVTSSAAVAAFVHETGTLPQNVNWAVKSEHATPLFDAPPRAKLPHRREDTIESVRRATCAVVAEREG